jgi:hypothetical protein
MLLRDSRVRGVNARNLEFGVLATDLQHNLLETGSYQDRNSFLL